MRRRPSRPRDFERRFEAAQCRGLTLERVGTFERGVSFGEGLGRQLVCVRMREVAGRDGRPG